MIRSEVAKSVDELLREVCLDLGFCNQLSGDDLVAHAVLDAEDFAKAVVQAEGMNPEYESKWQRQIRDRFVRKFGNSCIRLTDL